MAGTKQRTVTIFIIVIFLIVTVVLGAGYFMSSDNIQQTSNTSQQSNDNSQQQNNIQATIDKYKQQLAENPQDVEAMIALGNLYYDQQDYTTAIKYYESSLEFRPENINVIVDMGTCYYYKENPEPKEAVKQYDKALEVKPNFKQALFNKGVVLQHGLQDYQQARQVWNTFLEQYPNSQLAKKAEQFLNEMKN